MVLQCVRLETKCITDWDSFHTAFADVMGFPDFYGRNMNAWIDCMTYLDDARAGMTRKTVKPGELFHLEIIETKDFQQRLPEIFQVFIECAAFVNTRRIIKGEPPVLSLVLL